MRMWNVNPKKMCNRHLLGEHLEMHMFLGCLKKGTSIKGYIDKGLVEANNILARHDELVREMKVRGMNHNSGMLFYPYAEENKGKVDVKENERELCKRCIDCKRLLEERK